MVTRYAILQDIHGNVENLKKALRRLETSSVSKIIVNGDIVDKNENLEASMKGIIDILEPIAKTGLEVFVQAGSHENFFAYNGAIDALRKYSNIIDTMKQKFYDNEHRLVFIPGSDLAIGGNFLIRTEIMPSRIAFEKFGFFTPFATDEQIGQIIREERLEGVLEFINPYSLKSLVDDPAKTIVVCHIPRRFDAQNAVDVAYFAETGRGVMSGIVLEKTITEQTGITEPEEIKKIAKSNGYDLKRANVGNVDLAEIFDNCGVRFAVNGHIHEAGHRAHDKNCKDVEGGEYVEELFWNAGPIKEGKFGILTVGDGKVAYTNLST